MMCSALLAALSPPRFRRCQIVLPEEAGTGLTPQSAAHQAADAFLVHGMALVLQVPRHLPDNVERGIQELLVDQQHEVEVHRRFALRRVIEQ